MRRPRTRHDEWGKRALSLWLGALGDIQADARVAGETRHGDLLYTERREQPGLRRRLGLLGKLARGRVLFEVFRNPPGTFELSTCVLKVLDLKSQQLRDARRAQRPPSSVKGPLLCVVTPRMSAELAAQAGATPMPGTRGIYTLAPMWSTVIVVANQLAEEKSTLWFRLLGRDKVQIRAVEQLFELGEQEPLRDDTLRLLFDWQLALPEEQLTEDEQELRMKLHRFEAGWESRAEAKGLAEGEALGLAKGKAEAVLTLLEHRKLTPTPTQRKRVLACLDVDILDTWFRTALTATSVTEVLSSGPSRRPRSRHTATATTARKAAR